MKYYIIQTNRKNGNHNSERLDKELWTKFKTLVESKADWSELSELVEDYDGRTVDSYSRDFSAKLGEVEFDFVDADISRKYYICENDHDRIALMERYNIVELSGDDLDDFKIVANMETEDEWAYKALYKFLCDGFDYHGAVYLFEQPK